MAESNENTTPKIDGIENNEMSKDPSNRNTVSYPDGSFMNWDFTKGNEHVTIQHKTGSSIQITSNGSMKFVSAAGKMGFEVNGEGYIRVTGAYNIVVDGGASMRVKNNMDWYVGGDMKVKVEGTMTTTAKNTNFVTAEKFEVGAKKTSLVSTDTLITSANKTQLLALGDVDVKSTGGDTLISSSAVTTIKGPTKVDINP